MRITPTRKILLSLSAGTALLAAPFSQAETLIDETFSNGTLGDPVATESGNPSTDSSGNWIQATWDGEPTRAPVYGGDESNLTFFSEGDGLSLAYFDTNVDEIENFNVVFHNVTISSENREGTDAIIFAPRKNAADRGGWLDFIYEFRPVDENTWVLVYEEDDDERYTVAFLDGATLNFDQLEFRVHGTAMILYADGVALDSQLRETSGIYNSGFADDAFWVGVNSAEGDIVSIEFDQVTSETIGDFVPPPPPPSLDLPLVETFNHGTPGTSILNQPTEDDKARWRLASTLGSNAHVNYGGVAGAVTYEPFTDAGQASVFLESNVDEIENYTIKLDDLTLRGGRPQLTSSIFIGARLSSTETHSGYEFRQWSSTVSDGEEEQFRWAIWYRQADGDQSTAPGNLSAGRVSIEEWEANDLEAFREASEYTLEGLELRVQGNQQRLYRDGLPVDPEWRPTQGTYNDGTPNHAFQISTIVSSDEATLLNPTLHGLTIEEFVPPPPPPSATAEWQLVDDFAARDLGPIHEQGLWVQTGAGLGEVIDNPFGNGRVLSVSGGVHTTRIEIPDGETGTVFFRARSIGRTDFSIGASHADVPTSVPGTAAAQFAFRESNRNGLDVVEEGNAIRNLGLYDAHTWYNVWAVIDNEANVSRFYIQGGEFSEQTLLTYQPSEGDPRSEFPFRRNQDGEAIKSFAVQPFNPGIVYIDEIWFNGLSEDLTAPTPLPAPESKTNDGPLFAYEGFSYPAGGLLGLDGGSSWAEPFRPSGDRESPIVLDGSLTFEDLEVTGNRIAVDGTGGRAETFRFLDLGFTPSGMLADGLLGAPGSDVYVSFVVDGGDTADTPFFGISTFRNQSERLFIGKSQGQDHWAIQTPGGADRSEADPTEVPLTGRSFFVARQYYLSEAEIAAQDLEEEEDPIRARVYLFHNPDLAAGEPDVSEAVASFETTTEMIFNRFRIVTNDGGTGFELDELRVGSTWEAVTPVDDAEPPEGFAEWIAAQGVPEGQRGIHDDPDGDDIENLLEYALGGDPLVPNRDILPSGARETIDGQEYLTLTFSRPADVTDVDYSVDTAATLNEWTLDGAVHVDSVESGGMITETYRAPNPIDEDNRTFLRLRVDTQ